ncbi:hypothetical protein GGF31_008527 [Allomyces arbusculus]|nr:hypothetical protein GGF31_008527 [Allomyces arbusculus]
MTDLPNRPLARATTAATKRRLPSLKSLEQGSNGHDRGDDHDSADDHDNADNAVVTPLHPAKRARRRSPAKSQSAAGPTDLQLYLMAGTADALVPGAPTTSSPAPTMPLGHPRKNPRPQGDAALAAAEPAAKRPRSARPRPQPGLATSLPSATAVPAVSVLEQALDGCSSDAETCSSVSTGPALSPPPTSSLQTSAIPPDPIMLNTSAAHALPSPAPARSPSRSPLPALAPVDKGHDVAAHCDDGSEESDGPGGSDCGVSTPDHQSEASDDVEPEQDDASVGDEKSADGDALVGDNASVEGDESAEDDVSVGDDASMGSAVSDEDNLPVEDCESIADASLVGDDEQVEDEELVVEEDAFAVDDAPMEESDSVPDDEYESVEDVESVNDGGLVWAAAPDHHVGPHSHVDPDGDESDGDESDDDASVEDDEVVEDDVSGQDAEVEKDDELSEGDASMEEDDEVEEDEVVAIESLATAEPDHHVELDHVERDGLAFGRHDPDDHDGTSDDHEDYANSDDSASSADVNDHDDHDGSDEEDTSDSDDDDGDSVLLAAMHVPFNQPGQPTIGTSGTARVQTTQLHLCRDPIASSAAKPAPKSAPVTKPTGTTAKLVAVPRDPKSQHPASVRRQMSRGIREQLKAARKSFANDQKRLSQKLKVPVRLISMSQSDEGADSESGSATDSDSDSSSACDSATAHLGHPAVALPGNPLLSSSTVPLPLSRRDPAPALPSARGRARESGPAAAPPTVRSSRAEPQPGPARTPWPQTVPGSDEWVQAQLAAARSTAGQRPSLARAGTRRGSASSDGSSSDRSSDDSDSDSGLHGSLLRSLAVPRSSSRTVLPPALDPATVTGAVASHGARSAVPVVLPAAATEPFAPTPARAKGAPVSAARPGAPNASLAAAAKLSSRTQAPVPHRSPRSSASQADPPRCVAAKPTIYSAPPPASVAATGSSVVVFNSNSVASSAPAGDNESSAESSDDEPAPASFIRAQVAISITRPPAAADALARPQTAAKIVAQPPAATGTAVADSTIVSGSTSSRAPAHVIEPAGVSAPPRKSAPMVTPIAMPTSHASTSAGHGLGVPPRGSASAGKPIAVPRSSAPLVTTLGSLGGPREFGAPTTGARNAKPASSAPLVTALGPLSRGHGSGAAPEAIKEDLIALFESAADLDESANATVWDPPADLTVSLLPHQESGVQWMLGREMSPSKGGLLADEMGLGKTIQALALILATRDASDEHQATLVVAPTALCQQWHAELIDKSGGALKVLVHHGHGRTTQGSVLAEYDVVLTTYGTAMYEMPAHIRAEMKGERGADADAAASDEESLPVDRNVGGALFQVEFYRVILDEAHAIKTRENLRATACRHLRAQYRWCLTGTPLANSVDELYSLLEFLRCTVYPTRDDFRKAITDVLAWNPDRAMQRLRVLLSMYVLRRTKRLLGNLPRKTIIHEVLALSHAEQAFYETVRYRVRADVHAAGGRTCGYAYFYALLTRLRQAINHPHIVDGTFRFPIKQEEVGAKAVSNAETVEVNGVQVTAEAASLFRGFQASGALDQAAATEHDVEDSEAVVHAEAGEMLISATALEKRVRAFVGEVPRVFPNEEAGRRPWESTKIARAIHILQSPHREDPAIVAPKTIVFSQFFATLDLMESALKDVGIGYERFDGRMSVARKERALTRFKSDAKVSVLLMSLMCGSFGLNLTVASRIILLDLWWNPQIESQAFDRVHRLGQEHAVVVHKLTTQGTVEDRIVKMQDRKRQVSSDVLAGVQQADGGEDDAVDVDALANEGEGVTPGATAQRRRRGPKRGGMRMSLDEVLALFY